MQTRQNSVASVIHALDVLDIEEAAEFLFGKIQIVGLDLGLQLGDAAGGVILA
jgi:hypothetical protein